MTEKPNLEQLLDAILFVIKEFDEGSVEKVSEIARQIKKNPDYNTFNALRYTVNAVFDKILEQIPNPKQDHVVLHNGIWFQQGGYFLLMDKEKVIEVHKDAKPFIIYSFEDDKAKRFCQNKIGERLLQGTFNLQKFIQKMNSFNKIGFRYDDVYKAFES